MCQWGNYQNNLDVWKLIKNNDGEEELSNKSIKLYEIITILSGLCCGSLIGLSNSNNEKLFRFSEWIKLEILLSIFW